MRPPAACEPPLLRPVLLADADERAHNGHRVVGRAPGACPPVTASKHSRGPFLRRSVLALVVGAAAAAMVTSPAAPVVGQSQAGTIAVIAHPSAGESRLTEAELRRIFTSARRRWSQRAAVVPFNYPPGHPLRKAFDQAVLDLDSDEVSRFWIDQRIRGRARAPRQVPSVHLMQRVIVSLPGSIGYVPADQVPEGVLVLAYVRGAGTTGS